MQEFELSDGYTPNPLPPTWPMAVRTDTSVRPQIRSPRDRAPKFIKAIEPPLLNTVTTMLRRVRWWVVLRFYVYSHDS